MTKKPTTIEKRIFAVLVDNEPGVLARVIGLFSGRGYNIESLTVTEVDVAAHLSRITIITSGTTQVLDQIRAQLERLVPVHKVSDLTEVGAIGRARIGAGQGRGHRRKTQWKRCASPISSVRRVVDAGLDYFVFQMAHRSDKLDRFVDLMKPLGLVDLSRTGVVAIARGPEAL